MKRKLIALVLAFTFVLSLFTIEGFAATNAKEKESKGTKSDNEVTLAESDSTEGTITRAEWIHELVEIFDLYIDKDEYPDNYYSDITEKDDCYADVMAATWAGVLEIEAGDPVYPNETLTREFAVQTLNQKLGVLPNSDGYTFSDQESVVFQDDAQVAIENEWIAPVDGKFMPEKAVTQEEYDSMLAFARTMLNEQSVEEAKANFQFADYVIELPDDAEIDAEVDWENNITTLTIKGYTGELKENDTFVYYSQGLAFIYSVDSVQKNGDQLTIVTKEAPDEAIEQYECVGEITPDFEVVLPENNEDIELMSSDGEPVVIEKIELQDVDHGKDWVSDNQKIKVGGITGKLTTEVKHIKLEYSLKKANRYIAVKGDLHMNSNLKVDLLNDSNAASLQLAGVNLKGIGFVGVEVQLDMHVGIGYTYDAKFKVGASYNDGTISAIKEITTTEHCVDVEGEVSAMIAVTARVSVPKLASANATIKAGPVIHAYAKYYFEGAPTWCLTIVGYLKAGISIYADFCVAKKPYTNDIPIFTENSSPVRVYVHVEDGVEVSRCTRPNDPGRTETGYKVPKYHTHVGSRFYGGWSNTSGSWGDVAAPVIIWETSDNDDGTVTITAYHGNASVLNIPETIDDKTVTVIGNGAFKNNTRLRIVSMPNSITKIENAAFEGCSNMSSVGFSKKLTEIDASAFRNTAIEEAILPEGLLKLGHNSFGSTFQNCKELKKVYIPSTLESVAGPYGNFEGCSSLSQVEFGEGIKRIPPELFKSCDGLKTIEIPETVTSIGNAAFEDCKNLTTVSFDESLTEIDASAFRNTAIEEAILPEGLLKLGHNSFGSTFQNCKELKKVYIPSTLESVAGPYGNFEGCSSLSQVEFGEGIKRIPPELFKSCDGLKTIEIPETVTSIGNAAFEDCKNLTTVSFDESLTEIDASAFRNTAIEEAILPEGLLKLGHNSFGSTFQNCKELKKVYIPSTLESVAGPYGNFEGCSSLSQVEFGEGIEKIPSELFKSCDGLKTVVIPETVTSIGNAAFSESSVQKIVIPNSVTNYEGEVFSGCKQLTEVTLSKNAIIIPNSMFSGCAALESVEIPEGVTLIDRYTFSNCEKLSKIILPEGITKIETCAFEGCNSIKDLSFLPYTVTSIGSYAFQKCASLETVDPPDLVTFIGTQAFYECEKLTKAILPAHLKTIGGSAFKNDVKLAEVVFNPGLREIGGNAFEKCALKTVELPDSVTKLGEYAFADNSELVSVQLSSGLQTIPKYAFAECDNKQFTSLSIPIGVQKIEANAFYNDTYLLEFTIPASVTEIGNNAFSYIRRTTVNGVAGSYAENWSTVKWKAFNDISKPAEEIHLASGKDELVIPSYGYTVKPHFSIAPSDTTDFVVKLESADPNVVKVQNSLELSVWNGGETTITATTYHNKTYTFTVRTAKLEGFEVSKVPTKQKLALKENKDTTGLVISAAFADGTKEEWYDYSMSGYTTDIKGEHKVSVQTLDSYPSTLTSFSIYVDTDISGKLGRNEEVTWTDKEGNPEKIAIKGPVNSEEPLFVATYNENNRMTNVDVITKTESDSEIQPGTKTVKIIWVDSSLLPQSKNATINK